MRAVVFRTPGGPLEVGDFPNPVPGRGDAVVRVRAAALNHLDVWVLNGNPAYKIALPHALGSDVSGIVESVGEGVSGVRPGDAVVAYPLRACGKCEQCLAGRENLCDERTVLGAGPVWGGYAEMICVPCRDLYPLPGGISFDEAAGIPVTFITAWHLLMTLADLKPGQTVLVMGAGSGVGAAAMAIARQAGARVIATASTEEKRRKALKLGADAAVDHGDAAFWKAVRDRTGGRGVDVVVEHIGPAVFKQAIQCLASNGVLVTCGATTGPETSLDLRFLFSRQLAIRGGYLGTRKEFEAILRLFGEGRLKVAIDSTFPFEQAPAAMERLLGRQSFGKIILTHGPGG